MTRLQEDPLVLSSWACTLDAYRVTLRYNLSARSENTIINVIGVQSTDNLLSIIHTHLIMFNDIQNVLS